MWDQLLVAIKANNIAEAERIIGQMGPNYLNRDTSNLFYQESPLHWAAYNGHESIVTKLLKLQPNLISAVDKYGYTALHVAAAQGHESVVTKLIGKMPDLIDKVNQSGDTALHFAAHQDNGSIVTKLIGKMPDVIDVVDNYGFTALHVAAGLGHESIVTKLIGKMPDVIDVVDNYGFTALHVAAGLGHESIVTKLIEVMPDVIDVVDNYGFTALHLAAEQGQESVVTKLKELKHITEFIDNLFKKQNENYIEEKLSKNIALADSILTNQSILIQKFSKQATYSQSKDMMAHLRKNIFMTKASTDESLFKIINTIKDVVYKQGFYDIDCFPTVKTLAAEKVIQQGITLNEFNRLPDELQEFLKKAGLKNFTQNNSSDVIQNAHEEALVLPNISLTDHSADEELTALGSNPEID